MPKVLTNFNLYLNNPSSLEAIHGALWEPVVVSAFGEAVGRLPGLAGIILGIQPRTDPRFLTNPFTAMYLADQAKEMGIPVVISLPIEMSRTLGGRNLFAHMVDRSSALTIWERPRYPWVQYTLSDFEIALVKGEALSELAAV